MKVKGKVSVAALREQSGCGEGYLVATRAATSSCQPTKLPSRDTRGCDLCLTRADRTALFVTIYGSSAIPECLSRTTCHSRSPAHPSTQRHTQTHTHTTSRAALEPAPVEVPHTHSPLRTPLLLCRIPGASGTAAPVRPVSPPGRPARARCGQAPRPPSSRSR